MSAPAIHLQNVSKSFDGKTVLKGITLDIAGGEIVSLVGPSGSGKSTLLRILARLESYDDGRILVENEAIPPRTPRPSRLDGSFGMVFQALHLFPHLTALENVCLAPRKVLGSSTEDAKKRGMELLDRVGVAAQAAQYPATLSGGQQQRVAIARALAMNARVLLFDEPTSALDPERVRGIATLLRSLAAGGMTSIVVTHEIAFAAHAADRIAFLDGGELLEVGAATDFFSKAKHVRVRAFLDELLLLKR